jgi:hypothetical protein
MAREDVKYLLDALSKRLVVYQEDEPFLLEFYKIWNTMRSVIRVLSLWWSRLDGDLGSIGNTMNPNHRDNHVLHYKSNVVAEAIDILKDRLLIPNMSHVARA